MHSEMDSSSIVGRGGGRMSLISDVYNSVEVENFKIDKSGPTEDQKTKVINDLRSQVDREQMKYL